MKTLYLDLFSGLSGDMFLGAMIDLGVDGARLETELGKLGADGFHLHISRETRGGIAGVRFDVHLEESQPTDHAHAHPHAHPHDRHHGHDHGEDHHHDHGHDHDHDHGHPHDHGHSHEHPGTVAPAHGRTFLDIQKMIEASPCSPWVRQKAVAVFRRVAEAEGKIHGRPPEEVHFHEVGATDSIVDIVGACLALDWLGRPRVLASPVLEGTGSVQCAHGRLPLPAPATLEILTARGVRLAQCDEPHELLTPTGAALLAEFAESFGPMNGLAAQRIGYGLGARQNKTRPNVLRAVLCEAETATEHDWETDTITVLEANLDDISPEILGGLVEKALAAGALDVFHTPIQMKKCRPGVLLTILCPTGDADRFSALFLTETSAFGVRRSQVDRRKLRREVISVNTPHGPIEVKLGRLDGRLVQAAPEFESCRRLAAQTGLPLKEIYAAAIKASPTP